MSMDAFTNPPPARPAGPWRPQGCQHVALILQGGGALGAYQAGVYEALHEAGLEPNWVAGVSIGAINSALIAGNRREDRVDRLRTFWETITARANWPFTPDGDAARKVTNAYSAMMTMTRGLPGFFTVNQPGPWVAPRGSKQATSFYDTASLRETLLKLIDFDLINNGEARFAVGATNVGTGNFHYFDNKRAKIGPEHVMASGALPPALPMVQLGSDFFWDGGVVSNTPLQHLLTNIRHENMLVFQVDLFSARGPIPRDMQDVLARQKDIQFSSRTRLITDVYSQMHEQKVVIRKLLGKIPEADLSDEEVELKRDLQDLPAIALLHLIYQQAAYEGQAKDYEFSAATMREHWATGYRDTQRTLAHHEWLEMPPNDRGILVHDVHNADD